MFHGSPLGDSSGGNSNIKKLFEVGFVANLQQMSSGGRSDRDPLR